jgi:hypothetical protein
MKRDGLAFAFAALAVVAVLLYLRLIYRLNINWDEFHFLAQVHLFRAGALGSSLQTLHVHAFRWVPATGANEVDQIIAARFAYWLLLLCSCTLIYLVARRFMVPAAALFAVLCCLSYTEIMRHATAFRFDGLALFLVLVAVAALLLDPSARRSAVVAGVTLAVAILVTLKAAFFLPTLVLVLLFRPSRHRPQEIVWFGSALLVGLAIVYALHRAVLTDPAIGAGRTLQSAGTRTIRFDEPFPAWTHIRASVNRNTLVWLILLDGVLLALYRLRDPVQRKRSLVLLAFVVPLLSLIVYRNAFPYYFVFIMPPALILAGLRVDQLLILAERGTAWARPAVLVLVGAIVIGFADDYRRHSVDQVTVQRNVVSAVHEIFPTPVPYIDRSSMIASFPKVGFFMSTWGFAAYHERGDAIFAALVRQRTPRFVLANHPALRLDSTVVQPFVPGRPRLLPADFELLQSHFVHHWGPIYVAGRRLTVSAGVVAEMPVLIPGTYVLEAGTPVSVDGLTRRPGERVQLEQRTYSVVSAVDAEVTFRLDVPRPTGSEPGGTLFRVLSLLDGQRRGVGS